MVIKKKDWKDYLDPVYKDYINSLIKESKNHEKAYKKSFDPKIAQIWVALSILYRKISILENRIKSIEDKMKENTDLSKLKKL